MSSFVRPLIALSLTDEDESLLRYAQMLVQQYNWRELHFAHVVAADEPDGRQRLRESVRRFFAERTGANDSLHVCAGARLDQILRLVVEHACDVAVLGHRKMRSGRRALARRLAMVSPASVWLVPEGAGATISNILVPVDFSEPSADALAVAAGIARASGLRRLHAVHVFFDPSTVRYDEHVKEVVGREEEAFEKFIAEVDTQGVEVEPLLVEGTRTASDILRTAHRYDADLIVMSTRGRSQAASVLLGSTTSETMAATKVPLVAVKHYGRGMSMLEALLSHRIWEQSSQKTN